MKNKLAVIPFIFAAILLAGGCGKQNTIIKAHNQMVPIESAMIDSYNSSTTAAEQAAAVEIAVDSMQRIDVSGCPPDYQTAWQDVIQLWNRWQSALNSENINEADALGEQSPLKVSALNRIAKIHGVEIDD